MYSITDLLLSALPVGLPGALPGSGADPGALSQDAGIAPEGAFSQLLTAAQAAVAPAHGALAAPPGPALQDVSAAEPSAATGSESGAATLLPAGAMPAGEPGFAPISALEAGSGLPPGTAGSGRTLPPGTPMLEPAVADARAPSALHPGTPSPAVAAENGEAGARPGPADSPLARAAADAATAAGETTSRAALRPFAGGASSADGHDGALRAAAASLRMADAAQSQAADAARPAGADAVQRPPAAELAQLAAAAPADPRPVQERGAHPASRHGRSESSRTTEPSPERSAAPGAEGFEQQLRASALRTVAPVTVARDIGMIAERIEMLMHRRGDFANLNLDLGAAGDLQISVRMESRQAHISFVAQDAALRESLEQQLPRLRALLEQSGVSVGEMAMDLAGQSAREQPSRRDRGPGPASRPEAGGAEPAAEELLSIRRGSDGHHIIDAFA